jgi:glutamate synthase domain-containing protein 1
MCGIAGFLTKTENDLAPVGNTILQMLKPLAVRGPDSTGVALYGPKANDGVVVQIKLGKQKEDDFIVEQIKIFGPVSEVKTTADYLRIVIDIKEDIESFLKFVESLDEGIEIVSLGTQLEVIKQTGSPQNMDSTYNVSKFTGTHGLGHTRLSTESLIDLSHSQPFWAYGYPDLAIAHNGHITNYHKMRQHYEQKGAKFYTENDSEVIGIYLADKLSKGIALKDVLESSLDDLDGIENKINPGSRNDDNLYEVPEEELRQRGINFLPRSLKEAIDYLEADELILQALGPEYGKYYVDVKNDEWREYHNTVSEWETDNYLGNY